MKALGAEVVRAPSAPFGTPGRFEDRSLIYVNSPSVHVKLYICTYFPMFTIVRMLWRIITLIWYIYSYYIVGIELLYWPTQW